MKFLTLLKQAGADFGGFALLMTGAVCMGLLMNEFRDHQLPMVYVTKAGRVTDVVKQIQNRSSSTPSATVPSPERTAPQLITLTDFRRYVETKEVLILDARPEIFHRLGHVPGAVSFPREGFDDAYAKLRSRLENERDQPLLVYCSSANCEDSQMVADGLAKLGYHRVFVFKGGWDEWEGAHLPEEKVE
jgi:rhodanese-related sulfurtransferase